jgi:hypothetical protein
VAQGQHGRVDLGLVKVSPVNCDLEKLAQRVERGGRG